MGPRTNDLNAIDVTTSCVICGKQHVIHITNAAGYYEWLHNDGNIQDLLPELPADQRELLISRICKECFDEMLAGYEEDDDDDEEGIENKEVPADEQREPNAYGYPCDLDNECPYGAAIKQCCDKSMFAGRTVPCRSEELQ